MALPTFVIATFGILMDGNREYVVAEKKNSIQKESSQKEGSGPL